MNPFSFPFNHWLPSPTNHSTSLTSSPNMDLDNNETLLSTSLIQLNNYDFNLYNQQDNLLFLPSLPNYNHHDHEELITSLNPSLYQVNDQEVLNDSFFNPTFLLNNNHTSHLLSMANHQPIQLSQLKELSTLPTPSSSSSSLSSLTSSSTSNTNLVLTPSISTSSLTSTSSQSKKKKTNKKSQFTKKLLMCEKCTNQYTRRQDLNRHMDSFHNADPIHPCQQCGKKFRRKDTLRRHIHKKHEQD